MPAEEKQDAKQKPSRQQQYKQQQQRKSPTEEKEVPVSDDSKDEETTIPAATKYVCVVMQYVEPESGHLQARSILHIERGGCLTNELRFGFNTKVPGISYILRFSCTVINLVLLLTYQT